MCLTLQQLETGKAYVFRRTSHAFDEIAATFIALEVEPEFGRFAKIHVRDIETGEEVTHSVTAIADIWPLTREWLEARMACHATQVLILRRFASNLLNARKELS